MNELESCPTLWALSSPFALWEYEQDLNNSKEMLEKMWNVLSDNEKQKYVDEWFIYHPYHKADNQSTTNKKK